MRRELNAPIAADKILQQLGRESGEIEKGSGVERDRGIESKQLRSFLRAEFRESLGMFELAEGVASHRKRGHAGQTVFRMPGVGRKSSELKFDGQAGSAGSGEAGDIGVDAVGKRSEDCLGVGRVTFIFGLHITAIAQGAGVHIAGQRGSTENLGEPSLASAFPELHLEEAILGSDYSLGKEQIVLVLRVNVGNSPAITQNVD